MSQTPNLLIHEKSLYLLQHAYNPVQWYAWNEDSLQQAKLQDKPILLSIGYSACHWCHVMERESFEDEQVAALMNEYFICIKVDREERPDIDHIYMDALQAMTQSGGWPLNIFLTPDLKPFFGGTYFPPKTIHNRLSWTEIIQRVHHYFIHNREDVEQQANQLTQHLIQSNILANQPKAFSLANKNLHEVAYNLLQQADTQHGGFGAAPKFPQTMSLTFLLKHYAYSGHEASKQHVLLSLTKMACGGMFDHVNGGFARYSTDAEWFAPHFEKMLYDNALLLKLYAEAYALTNYEPFKHVVEKMIAGLRQDFLNHENGLYYAAMDADSEGKEGEYYVWEESEIDYLLGKDATLFKQYFNIKPQGNWEGKNILYAHQSIAAFCKDNQLNEQQMQQIMEASLNKLKPHNQKRLPPQTDKKHLLSWNALLLQALSWGYMCTANAELLIMAQELAKAINNHFKQNQNPCHFVHAIYPDGSAQQHIFLDDLAYTMQAFISMSQVDANKNQYWMQQALEIYQLIEAYFTHNDKLFTYSPNFIYDNVVQKKEVYDGATPSANAVIAYSLIEMSIYFQDVSLQQKAIDMLSLVQQGIVQYPNSFAQWALAFQLFAVEPSLLTVYNDDKVLEKSLVGQYFPFVRYKFQTFNVNDSMKKTKSESAEMPENIEFKQGFTYCKNYTCSPFFSDLTFFYNSLKTL